MTVSKELEAIQPVVVDSGDYRTYRVNGILADYSWQNRVNLTWSESYKTPLIDRVREILTYHITTTTYGDDAQRMVYLDDEGEFVLSGLPEGWSLEVVKSYMDGYEQKNAVKVTPPAPNDLAWCKLAHEHLMRRGFACTDIDENWVWDNTNTDQTLECSFEVWGMRYSWDNLHRFVKSEFVDPWLPNRGAGGYEMFYYIGKVCSSEFYGEGLCGDCATLLISGYGNEMIGGFDDAIVYAEHTDGDYDSDLVCKHCHKVVLKGSETREYEQLTMPIAPKMLITPDRQSYWLIQEDGTILLNHDVQRWYLTALNEDNTPNTNRLPLTVEVINGETNATCESMLYHFREATNYDNNAAIHKLIYFMNENSNKVVENAGKYYFEFEKIYRSLEPWDSYLDREDSVSVRDVYDECQERDLPYPEDYLAECLEMQARFAS